METWFFSLLAVGLLGIQGFARSFGFRDIEQNQINDFTFLDSASQSGKRLGGLVFLLGIFVGNQEEEKQIAGFRADPPLFNVDAKPLARS